MFAQPPTPHALSAPQSKPHPIQQTTPPPPQLYTSQAQFTPPSNDTLSNTTTTLTTTTPISPISPRASWHIPQHLQMPTRQIRQRQGPLYVPAVLRPTEKPARSSPPKTGGQQFGSPESMDEFMGDGMATGLVPHLSRIVTEEWNNEEVLGPVTGTPSRNHWKVRNHLVSISLFCIALPIHPDIISFVPVPVSTQFRYSYFNFLLRLSLFRRRPRRLLSLHSTASRCDGWMIRISRHSGTVGPTCRADEHATLFLRGPTVKRDRIIPSSQHQDGRRTRRRTAPPNSLDA